MTGIDEQPVHDASHAHALLRSWLREYKEYSQFLVENNKPQPVKSKKKQYLQCVGFLQAIVGDAKIGELFARHGSGKREQYMIFALESLTIKDDDLEQVELLRHMPVNVMSIDSKWPSSEPGILTLCLLAEHLLERLIQRGRCRSLADLASFVRPLVQIIVGLKSLDFEHADEFIYLLGDGYYAGTFDQSQQIPVFKTWVSRSSWTPKSEAKMTLLADRLAEERQAVYIDAKEFERSVFLAPGDYMQAAVTVDSGLMPI